MDRVRRWRCGAAAHAWHVEPRQEPATWAAVVAALLVAGREGAALHRAGHAPLRRRRADAGDGAGRRERGDPGAHGAQGVRRLRGILTGRRTRRVLVSPRRRPQQCERDLRHVAGGGAGASVTRALDRNLLRAIWMPDGKALLVGGHDGTRTALWLQPLDGAAPPKRLELGDVSPSWSFWLDASIDRNGAIAFTGSSPGRPTELYYLGTPGASPRRL